MARLQTVVAMGKSVATMAAAIHAVHVKPVSSAAPAYVWGKNVVAMALNVVQMAVEIAVAPVHWASFVKRVRAPEPLVLATAKNVATTVVAIAVGHAPKEVVAMIRARAT